MATERHPAQDLLDSYKAAAASPEKMVKQMDPLLILEQLHRQTHDVMIGKRGPASTYEWQLANILACVLDIMMHERRSKE